MHVTAAVISYNTADHIEGLLHTLADQTYRDMSVVVIDNNSHDESAQIAESVREKLLGELDVTVTKNDRNVGYAAAANQAIEPLCDDDAVFLVTPDVRLDPGHVEALVKRLQQQERTSSVQGRLHRMTPDGQIVMIDGFKRLDSAGHTAHTNRVFRNRGDGLPDDGRFEDPVEVFGVCGAAALHRVAALRDVAVDGEVFDTDLFAFFEDVDMDWRLKARGWEAWYEPDAVGRHERGGEGARRSTFVERLSYRNWFITVTKNDSWATIADDLHLVGATTFLRTADLVVTVPSAFLRAVGDIPTLRSTLRKRAVNERLRTVSVRELEARWFEPFNYAEWFKKRARRSPTLSRLMR